MTGDRELEEDVLELRAIADVVHDHVPVGPRRRGGDDQAGMGEPADIPHHDVAGEVVRSIERLRRGGSRTCEEHQEVLDAPVIDVSTLTTATIPAAPLRTLDEDAPAGLAFTGIVVSDLDDIHDPNVIQLQVTLDVLHVACALELKLRALLTFDDRQRKLAVSVGLKPISL